MAVLKPGDCRVIYTSNMGGKEQWQTIVKKIRAAASRAEVNKLPVVRVANRKRAADKASKAANKASKAANKVARVDNRAVKRVISKATADLFEEEVSSLGLTFILFDRSQARTPQTSGKEQRSARQCSR